MNIYPWRYLSESVFSYERCTATTKRFGNHTQIIVGFSEHCIRFGIEETDRTIITFPSPKLAFTIDLSTAKTIGNDILNISTAPRYKINWIAFIRTFVVEMEKENGIFAVSPFANRARKKLQKSAVYNLIVAKQNYEYYIKQNHLDKDEYNRIVSEYVDLLTHPKLASILPPDKVGEGRLFENPEYELQMIMQGKIVHDETFEMPEKAKVLMGFCMLIFFFCVVFIRNALKYLSITVFFIPHNSFKKELKGEKFDNVRKKIQNYFFRKHAIISAYYTYTGNILFRFIITLMFVLSIIVIFNDALLLSCLFWILIISILFIVNAIFINRNFNSLLPRIIIALVASWTLIVLSGDFLFSHLLFDNRMLNFIDCGIISIIVFVLYIECKEHSPYYTRNPFVFHFWRIKNWKECTWKIFPILSLSIFLSLSMGIIIQWATYKELLKEDNMLYSVTFSSEFKDIEHHISNTQLLIDNLETYKREISDTTLNLNSTKVHNHRKQLIDTTHHYNDTVKTLIVSIKENTANEQIINHIDSLLPLLHDHLHSHQNFIVKFYDVDSLLNLCCDTTSHRDYRTVYDNFFTANNKIRKNIIPVKIRSCGIDISFYLFPKLLVFHAFLAVLIAFVVQIIFTGKSVTEGL